MEDVQAVLPDWAVYHLRHFSKHTLAVCWDETHSSCNLQFILIQMHFIFPRGIIKLNTKLVFPSSGIDLHCLTCVCVCVHVCLCVICKAPDMISSSS